MSYTKTYTKTSSRITEINVNESGDEVLDVDIVVEFTETQYVKYHFVGITGKKASRTEEQVTKVWEEHEKYPFKEIDLKELWQLRINKIPGLVYKRGTKYYLAAISGSWVLNGKKCNLGKHECGLSCLNVCMGCPRTRDLTVLSQIAQRKSFNQAVRDSWRIEKYEFITQGLEAFNMDANNDAFIVFECRNFYSSDMKGININEDQDEEHEEDMLTEFMEVF